MTPHKVRGRRLLRYNAFSALSGLLALLLFCWPWVRVPRLSVSQAYLHFFGVWAILVIVMFFMSRALAAPEPEEVPRGNGDV
jgi:membrane associated rhomboid family serine protease